MLLALHRDCTSQLPCRRLTRPPPAAFCKQAAPVNNGTAMFDNEYEYMVYSELKGALGAPAFGAGDPSAGAGGTAAAVYAASLAVGEEAAVPGREAPALHAASLEVEAGEAPAPAPAAA